MSVEEFLDAERLSPTRHEYVAGQVYAMAGTTGRHNAIALNVVTRLRAAARNGPCAAYIVDLKVRAAPDRIYYPDGVVVCTPHDGDTLVFDEPCLVLEVTSRSTRRIDRGEKLDAYLAIPSLRAYVIAEQDRRHVTLYSREVGGSWNREEVVSSGTMKLPCPPTVLTLDDVYEGVEMPPPTVREDVDWEE